MPIALKMKEKRAIPLQFEIIALPLQENLIVIPTKLSKP
jgi:hypothetical protein